METPTYYELKSIEKDGLPKEGFTIVNDGDSFKTNYLIGRQFSDDMYGKHLSFPTHYLVPVSLPSQGKTMSEEYAEKIMEVAYYNFPLILPKETVRKTINALLEEYANQFRVPKEGMSAEDCLDEITRIAELQGLYCEGQQNQNALDLLNRFAFSPSSTQEGMKEEAIGFAEWILKNADIMTEKGVDGWNHFRSNNRNLKMLTTEQLYDLYQSQKQK